MRNKSAFAAAALLTGAVLLTACSGNGPSGSALPGSVVQSRSLGAFGADRSGVAPRLFRLPKFGQNVRVEPMSGKLKDLAVTDEGYNIVEIYDRAYLLIGAISNGIDQPQGDWYDSKGNLYVANVAGNALGVEEYSNGSNSPSFTYLGQLLLDPVDVTTDKALNVYVADYNGGYLWYVFEYPQGVSQPTTSCLTGLVNTGIAVAQDGTVLVAGINPSTHSGNIVVYPYGLCSVSSYTLPVKLGRPLGIQVLRDNTIVVADNNAGVDIIPPGWSRISKTITNGCPIPFFVAIDKKSNLYVTDYYHNIVCVDRYPSGKLITILDYRLGFALPLGVATYPSAK